MHVVCVGFAWLFDADGDLALIDTKKPVLERERARGENLVKVRRKAAKRT